MAAAVTSIDAATGKVKISWTEPDTRGSPITAYKVEVLNSLSSWIENTSQCNGALNPVLANKYCLLTMLDLYNADYYLSFQDLVVARVFAANSIGMGVASPSNTVGALVRRVPAKMIIPFKGAATTDSQIQVDWLALSTTLETGDSAILSYELLWDNGSGTPTVSAQNTLALTATLLGLN